MFLLCPHIHRKSLYALLLVGTLGTGGCTLTDMFKGIQTSYALTGKTEDKKTQDYLQTVLEERVQEKTQGLSGDDDADLRTRQAQYIEQTIKADLLKALHAKGYYNGDVMFSKGDTALSGNYQIKYGPKFTIDSFSTVPALYQSYLRKGAPQPGHPLDAQDVLAAQAALYNNIQKGRCYYDLRVNNQVFLNRSNNTGDVDLTVETGREGNFGGLSFDGNDGVKESYLKKLVPWKEGDCFRREKIEDYKTALLQTGLFSRADIILPEVPRPDGRVPVKLDVTERAPRTISAGLNYYSDEGLGGIVSWEHRNFFGAGEKLKASLGVSMLKQSLDFDFTKPYFLRKDQALSLTSSLRRQDTDAYEELGLDTGGSITRKFGRHFSASTGVNASILKIDDQTDNSSETYGLLSLPQTLTFDTRDDVLDPHKGVNLNLNAEPFFDILGQSDPFFKTQFTGSHYLALGTPADIVLATRGSIGSIWGAESEDIPATKRFYAGGGGSVRGYGYQEVGPQEDGDPTGGLSLVTASLEMRIKFTEKFGGVAFVDAGSVGEESTPEFNNLAVGAGLGVRYYTGFGPIRFDIATPLTQKEDLDQNYQFYISIGQAF